MYKPFASPFGRYTFWLGLPLLLIAGGPLIESPFALVDRLGHFPLQAAAIAIPLALVAFLRRKRPRAGWSLVVTLGAFFLNGAWLLPYLPVAAEPAHDQKNALKVVQLNVLRVNKSTKAVTDWIRKENPDVLVVQEIDSEWRTALADIQDLFQHRVLVERRDDFGIAVFRNIGFCHGTRLYCRSLTFLLCFSYLISRGSRFALPPCTRRRRWEMYKLPRDGGRSTKSKAGSSSTRNPRLLSPPI
jgi:hypothetical protein